MGSGDNGVGVEEAWHLSLELRQQMALRPPLREMSLGFEEDIIRGLSQECLQLHAEKKALASLLSHGEAELSISINFNTCIDCHEFFKISSQLLGCGIVLCQPWITHMFTG